MKQALKVGALALFAVFCLQARASGIRLEASNLNMVEISAAKKLLSEVERLLPQKLLLKFKERPVNMSFIPFGRETTWGAYNLFFESISINKKILVEKSQQGRHNSLESFRRSVIVHELAHHYDRSHFKLIPPRRRQGRIEKPARLARNPISSQEWFKNAIGMPSTGLVFSTRSTPSHARGRSPDPYEWKSPAEFFAVNLEFFLLDPNYQCKKPYLYKVFADTLEHTPHVESDCKKSDKVFVLDNALLGMSPLKRIDPERVYGIHYLFAGKGEAAMSRFGHAMLRLIICKPGRAKGPGCLKDLNHHLSLSYAALIDDEFISTIKGLKGDYYSVLNISPFTQTIQKYTEEELREVHSFPIDLDENQMSRLSDLLQERHWGYVGQYKFLSNNCSDETLGFLKSLLFENKELAGKNISRPDTLRDLLDEQGIIDTRSLADTESAALEGLYFPSKSKFYNKAMRHLNDNAVAREKTSLGWYFNSRLEERIPLIERALDSQDIATLAYTIALERKIYKQNQRKLLEKAKADALNSPKTLGEEKGSGSFSFLTPPQLMLPPAGESYGIPSERELNELKAKMRPLAKEQAENNSDQTYLKEALKEIQQHTEVLAQLLKKLLDLRKRR